MNLSKPYLLKIFDAKVQAKFIFSDYEGLCSLMLRSSEEYAELLVVCGEDQVKQVMQTKCEGIILEVLTKGCKAGKKFIRSRWSQSTYSGAFAKRGVCCKFFAL